MLVLTRKAGEKIVLNGDIIVTVVEVQGNRVKLAFDAPDDVLILRGELANAQQDPDLARKPAEWTQRRPVFAPR